MCVPLHLLLPFLLGIAHQYGYLQWFKREWVTLRWWKRWVATATAEMGRACLPQRRH